MSEKACPQCKQRYPSEAVRCPRDGVALAVFAPSNLSQLVGKVVDERYRIQTQLGEGGMGVVFRGLHSFTQRPVAIKVLRAEFASENDAVARFMQEAQSASRIGHENIIEIYDAGVLPSGEPYFAMELLEGKSLAETVKRGPMVIERAVEICAQICRGLAAAHRVGIIHRDIKPENIFLSPRDGRELVKILDFGIAKILDQESNLTKAGAILGTPHYMSPEQSSGSIADARSDIYAVGVLLYEMLTGKPPFTGSTMMAILSKQMLDDPTPPNKVRPGGGVWPALEGVVLKALKKVPEDRYQTMDDMEQALSGLLGNPNSFSPMTVKAGLPQPRQRELSSLGGHGEGIAGLTGAMAVIQTGQQRNNKGRAPNGMEDAATEAGGALHFPLPASLPTGGRAIVQPNRPPSAISRQPEALPMPAGLSQPSGKLTRPPTEPPRAPEPPPRAPEPPRQAPQTNFNESSATTVVNPPQRPATMPPQPIAETPKPPPKAPETPVVQHAALSAPPPVAKPATPLNASKPAQAPAQVASMPVVQQQKKKDPSGSEYSWGDQMINSSGDAWGDVSSRGSVAAVSKPTAANPADEKKRVLLMAVGGGTGFAVLIVLVYMIFFYNPAPKPTETPITPPPATIAATAPATTLAVADTQPTTVASEVPKAEPLNPKNTKIDPKNDPKNTKVDPKNDPKNTKVDPKNDPKDDPKNDPPKAASFKVMSNPAGAQVFVDGAPAGTTPLTLNSSASDRSITVKKEGYKQSTKKIAANSSSLVVITLDPIESEENKPELKDPNQ